MFRQLLLSTALCASFAAGADIWETTGQPTEQGAGALGSAFATLIPDHCEVRRFCDDSISLISLRARQIRNSAGMDGSANSVQTTELEQTTSDDLQEPSGHTAPSKGTVATRDTVSDMLQVTGANNWEVAMLSIQQEPDRTTTGAPPYGGDLGNTTTTTLVPVYPIKRRTKKESAEYSARVAVSVKDCILAPWSDWTDCGVRYDDASRGTFQTRNRPLVQPQSQGGKPCEPSVLVRQCLQ